MTILSHDLRGVGWSSLSRPAQGDPTDFSEHSRCFGSLDLDSSTMQPKEITELAERWSIAGRGGAGFPLARKISAVSSASRLGRSPIVVANGAESEPLSYKDRVLLWTHPHLVLDGLELICAAIGARESYLCIHEDDTLYGYLQAAVDRRPDHSRVPPLRLVEIDGGFVSGQETSLVSFLDSGVGQPRFQPPRPSVKGVRNRPTLISNVETLARLAQAYHQDRSGSRSGTLSYLGTFWTRKGGVVYEVESSHSLNDVLALSGEPPEVELTLLVGGYFGSFQRISNTLRSTPLERIPSTSLRLGAGVLVAFPSDACMVREAMRVVRYLGSQSAGQCGPCKFGLPSIASELESIVRGGEGSIVRIWERTRQLPGRGACSMPDGFSQLVQSVLHTCEEELDDHVHRGCTRVDYGIIPEVPRVGNNDDDAVGQRVRRH